MPSKTDPAANAKKTKQHVIVVLLLIGLLIAIVTQPHDSPAKSNTTELQITNVKTTSAKKKPEKKQLAQDYAKVTKLPEAELNTIIVEDLFAVREADRVDPESEEPEFQPLRVQAIYGSDANKAALVDDKLVRAGDILPDGRKVLSVTDSGVELQQQ